MLRMATLASGSSGNCAVISDGRIHILIDAGISARRIVTGLKKLGIDPNALEAILITHEHGDHVSGLPVLCRQTGAKLFTAEPTAHQLCRRTPGLESRTWVFRPGECFVVGDLLVGTFPTSHDCASPVGYTVETGRSKAAVCTDLGMVTQEVHNGIGRAGLLVGEFNYDVDMLRTGPYPLYLKERILSPRGHLDNEMGAELAAWAVQQGTRQVILAHLSKENNSPDAAMRAAEKAMAAIGARMGGDVNLTVAPRSDGSGWMEVPEC